MLTETKRTDAQPFREPIGARIGGGLHGVVKELGQDWVAKRLLPLWQLGDWRQRLKEDFYLINEFLGEFIPPTYFVEGMDDRNVRNLLIVQRRVDGRPIEKISHEELLANPRAITELDAFTRKVIEMYDWTGRIPDLHGGGNFDLSKQYEIKETDNILVEQSGRTWLIDTGLLGPLFSPNWVVGKQHIRLHVRSVHRFRQRLGLPELRKERATV